MRAAMCAFGARGSGYPVPMCGAGKREDGLKAGRRGDQGKGFVKHWVDGLLPGFRSMQPVYTKDDSSP